MKWVPNPSSQPNFGSHFSYNTWNAIPCGCLQTDAHNKLKALIDAPFCYMNLQLDWRKSLGILFFRFSSNPCWHIHETTSVICTIIFGAHDLTQIPINGLPVLLNPRWSLRDQTKPVGYYKQSLQVPLLSVAHNFSKKQSLEECHLQIVWPSQLTSFSHLTPPNKEFFGMTPCLNKISYFISKPPFPIDLFFGIPQFLGVALQIPPTPLSHQKIERSLGIVVPGVVA